MIALCAFSRLSNCRRQNVSLLRRNRQLVFAGIAALFFAHGAAWADVIFTDITTHTSGAGQYIAGTNGFPQSNAQAFTPTENYDVTGASAVFDGVNGGAVNFEIFSDNGGIPGTLLATLGTATVAPTVTAVYTESSPSTTVELSANTQYWLVLTPGSPATLVTWDDWHTSFTEPNFAATSDPTGLSGWTAEGEDALQFEVEGTLVVATPEPPSGWSAGILLAGTLFISRRKR
jgi:hypothetical protein